MYKATVTRSYRERVISFPAQGLLKRRYEVGGGLVQRSRQSDKHDDRWDILIVLKITDIFASDTGLLG